MSTAIQSHVRWMNFCDVAGVSAVDRCSFGATLGKEAVHDHLCKQHCYGVVAEHQYDITGFMLYTVSDRRYVINRIAVQQTYRRKGIAKQFVNWLSRKLHPGQRDRISLHVPEDNLPAQLWLRSIGFKAQSVLTDFYDEGTNRTAYYFAKRVVA